MSDKQKIPQFWDKGVMLVTGCEKVSPGCLNCWSERAHVMRSRNPQVQHIYKPHHLTEGKFNGKVSFNYPLLYKACATRKPLTIALWNDLYKASFSEITMAFACMETFKHHTYLIVTKRIDQAIEYHEKLHREDYAPHIWHIVTAENQAMADKRIPHLLRIPGKRGLIIEPMLEALILQGQGEPHFPEAMRWRSYLHGSPGDSSGYAGKRIHQVILGPENGPGKRPFDPAWADSVKAQCEAAGVPYYRKDTGEGKLAWR